MDWAACSDGGATWRPWLKLAVLASGLVAAGELPNSEVLAPACAIGSIGTKS
jgi:hypothetical protein